MYNLRLRISPRAVIVTLAVAIAALTALSAAVAIYKWKISPGAHETMMRIASLDEEGGLQTWYQSSTLLLCAGLMLLIARSESDRSSRGLLRVSCLAR